MESFVFAVDRAKPEPLYAQLTGAVRRAVAAGQLPAGAQLPSIRALSASLEVSKTTVESAYAQLLAEGYIASRPGSGYTVSPLGAVPPSTRPGPPGPPPSPPPPCATTLPPARWTPPSLTAASGSATWAGRWRPRPP